ncbi:alpha-(1,3)-fucosyltransferase C-like isoform X1 [Choristoneura fumiferana]|uniref:alpha-(1,3)-fucosyltransferase C-like isoform X1 n=1 Tax=Choristoneura fumiferana TaxID=7141 RepID=UPI003D159F27
MRRYTPLSTPQGSSKRSTFIFLLFCFAFPVFIIYVNSIQYSSAQNNLRLMKEVSNIVAQDTRFAENVFSKKLKYILIWLPEDSLPFFFFRYGQQGFIKNKCEFTNCFVTPKRDYLGGDITKFDAVAINGQTSAADLPQQRSPYQKFIFFNIESSTNEPACNQWVDGFFNWTVTYKLNSDIVFSYIKIRNSEGDLVGPRIDMEWITDMKEVDDDFKKKLQTKKKAGAWFASHCITRSKREKYVKLLQEALVPYGLTVDIYGGCGTFRCPRTQANCKAKVQTDYYFYLSFENAFAEDYVTEKLLTALNHNAVPIVYGGSNYSRFLPPGSYIDARKHEPAELAALMAHLISTPSEYYEYFRWRNHYSYSKSESIDGYCNVCAALNDKEKVLTQSVYEHFRSWWNPDWEKRCRDHNRIFEISYW